MSLFEHDSIRPAHMEVLTPGPLVFDGVRIRTMEGDMLCLTDMWKAAGEPDGKRPANWARKEGQAFIFAVSEIFNVPDRHTIQTFKGRTGGTYAHWQVAMAYAKYLKPEFHMWCNEVVRAHMDRRAVVPAAPAPMPASFQGVTPETLEAIDRTFGISKMIAHKVTQIEKAVPDLVNALVQPLVMAQLAERGMILVNGRTARQIWDSAGLPGGIKGSANWFGNRLSEMGCGTGNGKRGSKLVRLFDPDKVALCLRNGFLQTARSYADERRRKGRSHLRLV